MWKCCQFQLAISNWGAQLRRRARAAGTASACQVGTESSGWARWRLRAATWEGSGKWGMARAAAGCLLLAGCAGMTAPKAREPARANPFVGYWLEPGGPMPCGTYGMGIWHDGRLLCEKKFEVLPPER